MVEAFRYNIALTSLLQRIVANLVGGIDCFFEVACFQNTFLIRVIAPYTCKAVCLQLNTHRHLVSLCWAHLLTHLIEARKNTEQVLNVMPHFMRNHIGIGKVAGCTKLIGQFIEESQIKIKLAVTGAIKRTRCRRGHTAG